MKRYFLLPLALLLPVAAVAQSLTVTELLPAANATAASRLSGLRIRFSQPLAPDAGTAGGLRVFSSQYSGRLPGTPTVSGNTLSFFPGNDFQPGEKMLVTVPTTVRSSSGAALARPLVYEVTAAAQGGNGTFAAPVTLGAGASPFNAALGDVNNDGYLDMVVANLGGGTVDVRTNNGRGTFGTGTRLRVGDVPFWAQLADLDADGDLDILTPDFSSGTISILPNDGKGVFGARKVLPVAAGPQHLTPTDIDGDGDLDLLVVSNLADKVMSVLRNDGTGNFAAPVTVAVGYYPWFVASADVDGDGDQDALVANYDVDGTVDLLRNDGTGTFTRSVALRLNGELAGVTATDLDNDGDLDLLITDTRQGAVVQARNDGQGAFTVVSTLAAPGLPRIVVPADMNGDGYPDLVVSCQASDRVLVALNDGTGRLTLSATLTTGREPVGVSTGDLDYDGDLDLVTVSIGAVSNGAESVSTWLNNAAPLPVTLTQFTAALEGAQTVLLNWATAQELNSQVFEVERSTDGHSFAAVGTVPAAGGSSSPRRYQLLDAALPADVPVLYYRLQQVDQDGTFSYSPVQAVRRNGAGLALYPNPVPGGVTMLTGVVPGAAVQVLNALGQVQLTATTDATGAVRLVLPTGQPAGVYVVRIGAQVVRLVLE